MTTTLNFDLETLCDYADVLAHKWTHDKRSAVLDAVLSKRLDKHQAMLLCTLVCQAILSEHAAAEIDSDPNADPVELIADFARTLTDRLERS